MTSGQYEIQTARGSSPTGDSSYLPAFKERERESKKKKTLKDPPWEIKTCEGRRSDVCVCVCVCVPRKKKLKALSLVVQQSQEGRQIAGGVDVF